MTYSRNFSWAAICLALSFLLCISIVPLHVVWADECDNPQSFSAGIDCARRNAGVSGGLPTNFNASSLIGTIILWLLSLVAVLALLALIVGGVMYIVSFGSEDLAKRAKRIIMYAIIGLLVVFMSFAILSAVQTLFAPAPSPAPSATP